MNKKCIQINVPTREGMLCLSFGVLSGGLLVREGAVLLTGDIATKGKGGGQSPFIENFIKPINAQSPS